MTYKYTLPNGEIIILYPVSYLAKEINKTVACIHSWTMEGKLPKTPFQYHKHNYYSYEQILILKNISTLYGAGKYVNTRRCIDDLKNNLSLLFKDYGIVDDKGQFIEILEHEMTPTMKAEIERKSVKYVLPNGEAIMLYHISELAKRLNRTPQVLRKWEYNGVLPNTFFKTKSGYRLYTSDQIEFIAKCAEVYDLRNGVSMKATKFTEEVKRAYDVLLCHYGFNKKHLKAL